MQILQSIPQIEQKFYDSIYTLSHSTKTIQIYRTAINKLRDFLSEKYEVNELELKNKIQEDQLDACQLLGKFVTYLDKMGPVPRQSGHI